MKSTMFGTLVAGLVLAAPALAQDAKKAKPAKKGAKAAEAGHCVSNACKGSVAGAKNECQGKQACKGLTKEACEKDGKGTWTTAPAK